MNCQPKSKLYEKKIAYGTIQAVDVAGGVTAKFVFLHAEVRDVNVDARSVLDMRGICSFVCICLRKQSSHVTVDTLNACWFDGLYFCSGILTRGFGLGLVVWVDAETISKNGVTKVVARQ